VFDAAVTRENLARLYELKSDLEAAKEMRLRGAPSSIACGNYNVCRSTANLLNVQINMH